MLIDSKAGYVELHRRAFPGQTCMNCFQQQDLWFMLPLASVGRTRRALKLGKQGSSRCGISFIELHARECWFHEEKQDCQTGRFMTSKNYLRDLDDSAERADSYLQLYICWSSIKKYLFI